MPLRNYLDKVRRYFWFRPKELGGLAFAALVFAFILSFREWGAEAFDTSTGLQNLAVALIVVVLVMLVYLGAQRLVALKAGAIPEHQMVWNGILLNLAAVFLSNGAFMMYTSTSLWLKSHEYHRLGVRPTSIGLRTFAFAAVAGPLAALIFGALFKTILPGAPIADKVLTFSTLLAFWNLLPFPPLDGSRIFFASRLLYVFIVATLGAIAALARWLGWPALFAGLAIGATLWFIFYNQFERR